MASILNEDDEFTPTTTQTDTTTTVGGAPDSGGGGGAGGSAPQQPINTGTANQQDVAKITQANQGLNDFSTLLDPIRGQGTDARNAIGTANTNFNTGLGSFTGFDQNAQNTLSSVLGGQSPLTTGQGLLNNTYTGPNTVDYQTYDPLINKYVSSANQTQNQSGINTLLGSMRPELTPGERSYDSLVYQQNPNYQSQSKALVDDATAVQGLGKDTRTNAEKAVAQRQADIGNFNQAATGYVTNQRDAINQALTNQIQTQMQDLPEHDFYNRLANQQIGFSDVPLADLGIDPGQYAPKLVDSMVGGDFHQVVDPRSFLTFTPGGLATRDTAATPDQITRYNNAEQLLNLYDRLGGGSRQNARIGVNEQALQAAFVKAMQDREAADKAWLAAHQPPPSEPTAPDEAVVPWWQVGQSGFGGLEGGDGGESGSEGGGETGGEGGEGSEGEGGGGGYAQGGLIRARKPPKDALAALMTSRGSQPSTPPLSPQTAATQAVQQPIALNAGGYLPTRMGNPAVVDDIPAKVDEGEFVTRAPSVNAVGVTNMNDLNRLFMAPPTKQAAVRNALHGALSRAMR